MSRGVLPSFAFPVNVGQLHVLADEMDPDRRGTEFLFRFDRDMKIALAEYAPAPRWWRANEFFKSWGWQVPGPGIRRNPLVPLVPELQRAIREF